MSAVLMPALELRAVRKVFHQGGLDFFSKRFGDGTGLLHIHFREDDAQDDHEHRENSNEVAASKDHVAVAAFSSRHYFPGVSCFTHALIMSIGSGNTMVVFFSAPISVSVCR